MDEREIFIKALEISDQQNRLTWLNDVAPPESDLRRRVDRLLQALESSPSFLENSALEDSVDAQDSVLRRLQFAFPQIQAIKVPRNDGDQDDTQTLVSIGPQISGRYELLGEIGRGGVGSIQLCRDLNLQRDLAAKILHEDCLADPNHAQRLVEEAQIAGQLQHPGIVAVHELGQLDDKRPFFTMKLVKGETLAALLKKRQSPSEELRRYVTIFGQVCQAVAYAHSRSVIHRDLKPSNIMIGKFGEVLVMDWGLAKVLDADLANTAGPDERHEDKTVIQTSIGQSDLLPSDSTSPGDSKTSVGSILGTPAYMPPEQATGRIQSINPSSDVFGLGAILCEILTGEPPYVARSGSDVLLLAVNSNLEDCRARLRNLEGQEELAALTLDCLVRDQKQRIQDASEIVARLDEYQASAEQRLRQAELDRAAEAARAKTAEATALVERRARFLTLGFATILVLISVGVAVLTNYFLTAQQKRNRIVQESLDTLYVGNMQMASQSWNKGAVNRVRKLLDAHIPQPGEKDRRGYEWYFLQRRVKTIEAAKTIEFGEIVTYALPDPQERYLVVAGVSGVIKVYDLATHNLIQTITEHPQQASRILVSDNGDTLVTMDWVTMRIWRWKEGQFSQCHSSDGVIPLSTWFSANNQKLLVPYKKQVQVWDLTTETPTKSVVEVPAPVWDMSCRGDNRHVVVALTDETVQEWDWIEGRVKRTYPLRDKPISMGISSDGNYVAVADEKFLHTIDLTANDTSGSRVIADIPTGTRSVHGFEDCFLVRNETEAFVWTFDGEQRDQLKLGYRYNLEGPLADGSVVFHTFDHLVSLYSPKSSKMRKFIGHENTVYTAAVLNDGRIVSGGRDETVRIFDPTVNAANRRVLDMGGRWVWGIDYSPDSQYLVTATGNSYATIWDVKTGKALGRFTGHSQSLRTVNFSPDGNTVASAGLDQQVLIWNIISREPLVTLKGHTDRVNVVRFSPDGRLLLSGGSDGRIIVWDLESEETIASHQIEKGEVWAARFLEDDVLVFGGTNRQILKWNFRKDQAPQSIASFDQDVTSIELSHSRQLLACTIANGKICMLDFITNRKIAEATEHTSDAMYTSFSPDDRTLVSCGSDGTIVFWSVEALESTLSINAHNNHIHCVTFSPDGKQLATGARDATACLWNINGPKITNVP